MQNLLNTLHTNLVFGRRVQKLSEALGQMIPVGSRVLDVGCGDGQISARISENGKNISVAGIDVLVRPQPHIPVTQFDGTHMPFEKDSFDLVMFVDVLHHTEDPAALLAEAARVSRKYVLLKDHFLAGPLGGRTLRLMDWFGNAHHGVVLPYNYLSETEWNRIYNKVGLRVVQEKRTLGLYPIPANLIFGRGLHFVSLLEKTTS
ncbi:MAG: methyltransferase domain-containing protein [Chthoniobacterales bacterium]|nr:methyltransferase domain-containing protein [Chthoniobacterales bacterium]